MAVSKGVEENSRKKEAAWKVLMAMTSSQAQEVLNEHTDGLISYKRDITFEYSGAMSMVQKYLETNRTYLRLGSEEFLGFPQRPWMGCWKTICQLNVHWI